MFFVHLSANAGFFLDKDKKDYILGEGNLESQKEFLKKWWRPDYINPALTKILIHENFGGAGGS
jgi:hypothetical protein